MAVNKNALMRYRIIDRCLTNSARPYPTKADLQQACEEALYGSYRERISASTIEKDMWAMKNESSLGFYAPIAFNREHRGYHYTDPDYSINAVQLNDEERDAIHFAARTLLQYRDLPVFAQFDQALGKIQDRLSLAPDLDGTPLADAVQFETAPVVHGSEHLGELFAAIRQRRVVDLAYRKFNAAQAKTYRLAPHLLKEYRNRWYLIAWSAERGDYLTFGLDRVEGVGVTDEAFSPAPDFSSDRFFEHSIGITEIDAEPQDILLHCTPIQARYMESQPLHATQRIRPLDRGRFAVTLRVLPTYELVEWILGCGPAVEVVSPVELRERIREQLANALSFYTP
jgi:predicted DNA-binding transcriptional regulator YafY